MELVVVVCGDRGFCFPVCLSHVRQSSPTYKDLFEFPPITGGKVAVGYVVTTEEDREEVEELGGFSEDLY